MTAQIVFLGILGVLTALYGIRFLRTRSVLQYTPAEVDGKIREREKLVLLDVRTERERSFQHIRGSVHIPVQQLSSRSEELKNHLDKEIVCYCQSGNRSLSAAIILRRSGFRAASMRGGIVDWNFHHKSA